VREHELPCGFEGGVSDPEKGPKWVGGENQIVYEEQSPSMVNPLIGREWSGCILVKKRRLCWHQGVHSGRGAQSLTTGKTTETRVILLDDLF